jgi:hypothetical protein
LNLSDEGIELADRHDIDEKKLRYVLPLPKEFHSEIVRQIIDFSELRNPLPRVVVATDG